MVAAAAGIAGYYFNQARLGSQLADVAAERLMRAALTDLDGKAQTLERSRGKILVVNFWATWCPPCREEIPALMNIQSKYSAKGVEIVGIAIDNVVKVRQFADEIRVNYDFVIGSTETLDLSRDLGNQAGVLPYTAVLDRSGKVVYTHAGALTEAKLESVLKSVL